MASLNKVFLIGNLTRDPELRFTPSGTAVANIGIAVNNRYQDNSGNWVDEPNYFTVVAWGRQAELSNEHLRKGSPILVEGRLQWRSWETPEGQKRSVVEVVANRVQFLNKAAGRSEESMAESADAGLQALGEGDFDDIPF
jgi:single-strand DNA-binding protein